MSKLPYKDSSLPVKDRVEDLLTRMTIEEKVGQLLQVNFDQPIETYTERLRQGLVGSRILAGNAFGGDDYKTDEDIIEGNEVQRIAVEESRLGIPVIYGRDVIHGHRTVFPISIAQACSWDTELVKEAQAISAKEAASFGVHWTFAPMMDVARDPRWGRVMEGYGEDPYLAARMAEASVIGLQGVTAEEKASEDHIVACAKHFVAYGGAEGGRDYGTVECTDNTLRNFYLPPFKAAVDAGVGTVMSGFHEVGGEPVSGSKYLLTEVLKEELGFDGYVISDWGSVWQLVSHHVCADSEEAGCRAFDAGVDMDMCTNCFSDYIKGFVEEGRISQERLDDAVRRILTVKFEYGLFEHPYTDPKRSKEVLLTDEHKAVAEKLAAESEVLLKNDNGVLPLSKASVTDAEGNVRKKRIAVVGPMVNCKRELLGNWELDGRVSDTMSFAEAMREMAGDDVDLLFSTEMTDRMVLTARRADVIVVAVGESNDRAGESNNIAELSLPVGQKELIEELSRLGKPVITVVFAARPLAIEREFECSDALLYAWHGGTMTAQATSKILFGDIVPSGKLPMTFPRYTGQVPIYYNHKRNPHSVDEYLDGGPRLNYNDRTGAPLFPFGYGLSYTTFEYGKVTCDKTEIKMGRGEEITFKVDVTNTGDFDGAEIVQLYIRDEVSEATRPVRELKGFARVDIKKGETETVELKLNEELLSYYNRQSKWVAEPGEFTIFVGKDCMAAECAKIALV